MDKDAEKLIKDAHLGSHIRDARIAKTASLVASGLKKHEIAKEMGIKNPAYLIRRAHETGLVGGIQSKQVEDAMDLAQSRRRIAERCLRAMETGSEMLLEEIEDVQALNEGLPEGEKEEIPLSKLKMAKDLLDSTEFSGKKVGDAEDKPADGAEIEAGVEDALAGLMKVAGEMGLEIKVPDPENSGSEDTASPGEVVH